MADEKELVSLLCFYDSDVRPAESAHGSRFECVRSVEGWGRHRLSCYEEIFGGFEGGAEICLGGSKEV